MNHPEHQSARDGRLNLAISVLKSTEVAAVSAGLLEKTRRGAAQPPLGIHRKSRRFLIALVAVIVVVTFIRLFQSSSDRTMVAFADVVKGVNATKTLTAIVNDPREDGKLLVSGTRMRFEGKGVVHIADSESHQRIMLDAKAKLAYRIPQQSTGPVVDFYALIRDLAKGATKSIEPYTTAQGRQLPGHQGRVDLKLADNIETWKVDAQVWSDPTTKLPVRAEIRPADPAAGKDFVIRLESIEFDGTLDEKLFDMKIPAGFTLAGITAEQLRAAPSQQEAATLTIVPKVGIGEVRFGMSREQIAAILGEPETTLHGSYLCYPSKGLQLVLVGREPNKLGMIIANPADASSLVRNEFPGQTDKGIRIGSTEKQVIEAYGEPDRRDTINQAVNKAEEIGYKNLLIGFSLRDGKVRQISLARH